MSEGVSALSSAAAWLREFRRSLVIGHTAVGAYIVVDCGSVSAAKDLDIPLKSKSEKGKSRKFDLPFWDLSFWWSPR